MSDVTAGTASSAGRAVSYSAAGNHNPWLIAVVISIATFMEVLDTTIANVALVNIAGRLSASVDQSTWILTSYLVANSIILPISGWLATVLGRKRFYMGCVAVFTISSFLCGIAWNLESLIFFRILQGLGGGGLASSEQSILADSFPPEQRGKAFALYGLAVVVAPAVGPTLGGWITDNASWHWVFFINVPMGLLSLGLVGWLVSEPSGTVKERNRLFEGGLKIDYLGFAFVALGLGSLEVVLDEGERSDWFASNFIVGFALVSATSLIALVVWELQRKEPIVDIRLLGQRQFASCFWIMMVVGAILIGTTQLVPQLLQSDFGYTATLAGLAMSPGGLLLIVLMPIAGILSGKFQPRILITVGLLLIAFAMWYPQGLTPDFSFWSAAWMRVLLSLGLPLLFLPLTAASYAGLSPTRTNQASALFNVARNLGGSMGVAMTQTMLQTREQVHHSRLTEHLVPSSAVYQETLHQLMQFFQSRGASALTASGQALGWIAQALNRQASLLAFIDVSWIFMIMALATIPLVFLLRPVDLSKPAEG